MARQWFSTIGSPVGPLTIEATEQGIASISFGERPKNSEAAPAFLEQCIGQLNEYFGGARREFSDLPLVIRGTDFQTKVWDKALTINYGATVTYGGLAAMIGEPAAARAVGNALNRNPLCIIVPCHRIVGADDQSGGYGGGMDRKTWLLRHEGSRAEDRCPACNGDLVERKLKKHCARCGVLCETCCDGGRS